MLVPQLLSAVLDTAAWIAAGIAVLSILAAGVGEYVRCGQAVRLFRRVMDVAGGTHDDPEAWASLAVLHRYGEDLLASHRRAERLAVVRMAIALAVAVVLTTAAEALP